LDPGIEEVRTMVLGFEHGSDDIVCSAGKSKWVLWDSRAPAAAFYTRILQGAISMIIEMLEPEWITVIAKRVTPSLLHLHLTLPLMTSMENSCLLSPLVGRSLLLPMTMSTYLHMLPLPAFILIQVTISQVHLFLLKVVPIHINSVHCHQERPMDINIHCFSMCCHAFDTTW